MSDKKLDFRKTALTKKGGFTPAKKEAVAGVDVRGQKPIKKNPKSGT